VTVVVIVGGVLVAWVGVAIGLSLFMGRVIQLGSDGPARLGILADEDEQPAR
jgi:hypothetical protein